CRRVPSRSGSIISTSRRSIRQSRAPRTAVAKSPTDRWRCRAGVGSCSALIRKARCSPWSPPNPDWGRKRRKRACQRRRHFSQSRCRSRQKLPREDTMRPLQALLLSVCAALATITAAQAQPLLIRNSYVVPVSNWAPLLVAKKELAKHWGKSYDMEAVRYQGTPQMITAVANGELEIANLAYSTLGIAITNAGISDLRVISDEFPHAVPGNFSNQYFVRKDSGIKKIEDLKGKVLATNLIGTGVDIAMKAGLKKHGLVDKSDYTVIEAPFPTMPAMLNERKADLVTGVMP